MNKFSAPKIKLIRQFNNSYLALKFFLSIKLIITSQINFVYCFRKTIGQFSTNYVKQRLPIILFDLSSNFILYMQKTCNIS